MISRRLMLTGGGAVVAGLGFYAAGGQNLIYTALTETIEGQTIDALMAYQMTKDGEIALIDIRRPDEWEQTGSGEGAMRLDMRREDFMVELDKIIGGDRTKPVALICARGVRSARMNNRLVRAGFTNIIDVPEGMLGSAAGPGWIARDLPMDNS